MRPLNLFYDRSYGYFRGVLTSLLGLVFIIWPDKAKSYICLILGVIILILGLAALVRSNVGKGDKALNLLSVNGFLDIVFGVVLIVFSDFFVNLLTFLFGFMLLVFGISSIIETISVKKNSPVRWTVFLFPVLIALVGLAMFFLPKESSDFVFRLFGIAILAYGVFEIYVQIKVRKAVRSVVEDVPFVEAEK